MIVKLLLALCLCCFAFGIMSTIDSIVGIEIARKYNYLVSCKISFIFVM